MRVLVTGASRGIGRAVCARLARDGAQVAACASAHRDELDTLVAEIRSAGGVAVPLPGDLRDGATPARLVREAAAALGGLDAVVGNAGISSPGPLATLDVADWDRVFAVNLRAQFLLTHPVGALAVSPNAFACSLFLAIGATVIPSFLMNAALHRISAQANAVIGTLSPIATIALAAAILGEVMTGTEWIGAVLIIAGVGWFTLMERR